MTLINSLPTVPSRSSGFSAAQAEVFLEALPDFVTETNAALAYFDLRNADASAVTMWVAGGYTKGAVVWSPATGTNYRAKTTHTSATDPSLDGTNWSAASGVSGSDQAKLDLITITEPQNLDAILTRPVRTADGAISAGDILARQSDGTVAAVASEVTGPATGSNTALSGGFQSSDASSSAADPATGKFLIAYSDDTNSDYGTAVVATVTGTSVSLGTPAVFESAGTFEPFVAFDPDNEKFLIVYKDTGNSSYLTAVVATVSGTGVTFGTPVSSGVACKDPALSYDTANDKFLCTYKDSSNRGVGVVISISGTTPSFGSATQYDATTSYGQFGTIFDTVTGKHLVIHGESGAIKGYLATISGTSVSFGSEQTIASGPQVDFSIGQLAGPDSNGKYLLSYSDQSDGQDLYNVVITISGATISGGTPVEFNDAASASVLFGNVCLGDDFYVIAKDGDNSFYLTSYVVTVTGTVPSAATGTVLRSANITEAAMSYDATSGAAMITYRDPDNSNYGAAFVHKASSIETNAGDWFAIAASDAADTEDVQLFKVGDIVDDLSGLTYGEDVYVEFDGSFTHSVTTYGKIGYALSATELLITETN